MIFLNFHAPQPLINFFNPILSNFLLIRNGYSRRKHLQKNGLFKQTINFTLDLVIFAQVDQFAQWFQNYQLIHYFLL